MYCYFTKSHTLPMVFRVSSPPKCFKPFQSFKIQSFSVGSHQKASENLNGLTFRSFSNGFPQKTLETLHVLKPINFSTGFHQKQLGIRSGVNPRNFRKFSSGFSQKCPENKYLVERKPRSLHLINGLQKLRGEKTRNFSSGSVHNSPKGDREVRVRKTLPWIAAYKNKGTKGLEKVPSGRTSSSSWEESADSFFLKNDTPLEDRERRSRTEDMIESRNSMERAEIDEAKEEDSEIVDDSRWDTIKSRYRRISFGSEKPEVHRWNKQENWGRKTWKEATESTLPKMVGEGIYGVGPILAALTAGRREFYALYVQEGLDLSNNNRKKKDKKGFEKVLKIAERIGLAKKEASKHDLNMIVDNRPHQGLVLDASPLDLVSIRELDPVLSDGEKGPLWVALDEVTDPQNLGAIIRSTYFFGASGVVLCAKNSAPLSGVVSKASAGSLELMELRSCKNMMQFLASSAENGWRVLGGSISSRALPLNEVLPGAPTILVLGSEGTGLRPLVERSCTHLIRIPGNIPMDVSAGEVEIGEGEMDHGRSGEEFRSFLAVESLNVSVAAGVLLHHLIGNNGTDHPGNRQPDTPE